MRITKWTTGASAVPNAISDEDPRGDRQRKANLDVMELASDFGVPLLLTGDAHMVDPSRKLSQDILLQNGNPDGWRFCRAYYQMTTEQAWDKWAGEMQMEEYRREFKEAVENNEELVDMIGDIGIEPRIHLPRISIPEDISDRFPRDPTSQRMKLVARLVKEHGRMPIDESTRGVYVRRLQEELEVIAYNGAVDFLPYFLFVEDLCRKARDRGQVPSPGRGSAAGSLLSYLLKITHLDPIEWDLSFFRFLSIGRINRRKFPDIDLDFAEPGWVAEMLKAELGDRFIRICTLGTIKPRSAIREVARALMGTQTDHDAADQVDEVCKSLSNPPQGMSDSKGWLFGFEDEMEVHHEGEVDRNPMLARFFEQHPEVMEGVRQVLDIPKSIGRHAAAYAASDVPIPEIAPICVITGEVCTQNPMGPIEAMGLIKIDLLGLNTLKDIQGTISWVQRLRGVEVDIYDIPKDDPKTWKAFQEGRNETVFQFNKGIGVDLCKRYVPENISELAQITAAGRPGTMYSLMPDGETTLVDQWIAVKQGEKSPEYVHPSVERILEPTRGVCLFQEQISAMFQVACGYSEEEADEIREIVGKKKKEKMDSLLPEIRRRLVANGWSAARTESFISLCVAAANYSFNKSHSLCYAYLAYVCQYLKENYPVEWWASVLQNSSKDDLKANARYCSKYISPPDVMVSQIDVFVADRVARSDRGRIVFPLSMVHGVKSAALAVVAARPFSSLEEMYEKVDKKVVNKRVFAALIWSGAMDAMFGIDPEADGISGRNLLYMRYLEIKRDKEPFERFSELELMKRQGAAFPMIEPDYAAKISQMTDRNIQCVSAVASRPPGSRISVGGVIREIKAFPTKKGDEMSRIKVCNGDSTAEITVFPDLHSEISGLAKAGDLVIMKGRTQDWQGRRSLVADEARFPENE